MQEENFPMPKNLFQHPSDDVFDLLSIRKERSLNTAFSMVDGRTKVVSHRLNCRAMSFICVSVRLSSMSSTMASGLPLYGVSEKTSTMENGRDSMAAVLNGTSAFFSGDIWLSSLLGHGGIQRQDQKICLGTQMDRTLSKQCSQLDGSATSSLSWFTLIGIACRSSQIPPAYR